MQNISLMYVNRSHGVVYNDASTNFLAHAHSNRRLCETTRDLLAIDVSVCLPGLMDILRALLLAFLVVLQWKLQSVEGYI